MGALGYEPRALRNFNNLQDASGSLNPYKERLGSIIGRLMDGRSFDFLELIEFRFCR
jgi:hypothetical protein